ncbi:amidohydrolase family protein [Demequina litorisediminis]|uniref:Amidohydrolase-related domain-containing protein n=1 Tax=Demequina litorisediminis TaxID=1849022 RepID=A0ABQ6IA64_9MICO|nr:hypothetical protein GCM10025876_08930 [Demequina litorisediminis]
MVDTDEEVIKAVRTLLRTGADVIKVCTTGGISTPTDSPDDLGLSEQQVRLIASEVARRGGRAIAAHAQGHEGAMAAVLGGTTSLEHGYEMSDALITEMLARGTVLVPTLSTLSMTPDPAVKPAEVVAKKLEWQVRGRDAAARAIAAGVPVALGTDAGIHPQGQNLAEPRPPRQRGHVTSGRHSCGHSRRCPPPGPRGPPRDRRRGQGSPTWS